MTKIVWSLEPLDLEERTKLSMLLCDFFSTSNLTKYKKYLELSDKQKFLSFEDFFVWTKKQGYDLDKKRFLIAELVLKLEQKGILVAANSKRDLSGTSQYYYFIYQLSTLASKGSLWLGTALGANHIGNVIRKDLALITGRTGNDDCAVGTGLLAFPGIVLTCAHVITDMKIDNVITIGEHQAHVRNSSPHHDVDIGVIFLEEKISPSSPDIAFRPARLLEEVVIAGYPTIPRGLSPIATFHRGEICGHIHETTFGHPLELFSAIARPGNSGGPVVGLDGRVVGIVSKSLERGREEADFMVPLPFFVAIPSEVVQNSFRTLTNGLELPWENYH